MKLKLHKLKDNQSGMASIIITLIFLIVISLTVLGFAQLSRRESRSSLDRQLSTQAFYAAESGVNDALAVIKNAIAHGQTVSPKTTCDNSSFVSGVTLNPTINGSQNVDYTCVLVNPAPNTLVFNPITTQHSKVIWVQSSPPDTSTQPATIDQINLSWQDAVMPSGPVFDCGSGSTSAANGVAIPPAGNWSSSCGASMLRVEVVPGSPIDLNNDTPVTLFLYPKSGGSAGSPTFVDLSNPSSAQGKVVKVACTSNPSQTSTQYPNDCSVTLKGLSGLSPNGAETGYYLRVQPIYTDQNLTVSAENGGTTTTTNSTTTTNVAVGKPVSNPYCPLGYYYHNQPDSNLTDDNDSTNTSQCSYSFAYTIDLQGNYNLSSIQAVWGTFGCWPRDGCDNGNAYITSWNIAVSADNSSWTTLASGSIPHSTSNTINGNFSNVRYIKVSASSGYNWIAMYELRANATTTATTTTSSSGSLLNLMNDQVVIDSTGQAQDVLRRIQVRASVNDLDTTYFPDEALHSTNALCKEFYIVGSGQYPLAQDGCSYP